MENKSVHDMVKSGYANLARQESSCCAGSVEQATGSAVVDPHGEKAVRIGYAQEDIAGAAAAGNLGLGCGNPIALASLKPGDVVVDLGSGAGFDALIAADRLGPDGRFIGVDMTPEMLERARVNAVNAGYARTVEFREGLIEKLPVAGESVDVVISNCVINLSPDKAGVFREAFRVLKPGGRLAVSDIILSQPLPVELASLASSWIACVGGALTEGEYLGHIRAAGFHSIEFTRKPVGPILERDLQDPVWKEVVELVGKARLEKLSETVFSYSITAEKLCETP